MGTNGAMNVGDAIERVGLGFGQYLIIFGSAISLLGEGMQLVVMFYLNDTLNGELGTSDLKVGWLDTAILVGLGIGCFAGGSCADAFGRKGTLQVANLFSAMLGVASAFAPNWVILLICRFSLGIALGAFIPGCVSLLMETIPSAHRSLVGIALPIALGASGKILVALLADLLHEDPSQAYLDWRTLLFVCSVPDLVGVVLDIIGMLFPSLSTIESPHWLLIHHGSVEASDELRRLAEQNGKGSEFPKGTALSTPEKHEKEETELHYLALLRSPWASPAFTGAIAQSLLAFTYFGFLFAIPMHLTSWVHDESRAEPWTEQERDTALVVISLAELPAALVAGLVLTHVSEVKVRDVVIWSIALLAVTSFIFGGSLLHIPEHPMTWIFGFLTRGLASLAFEISMVHIAEEFPHRFRATALSAVEGFPRFVAAFSPEIILSLQRYASVDTSTAWFQVAEPEFIVFSVLASIALVIIVVLLPAQEKGLDQDGGTEPLLD